VKPRALKCAISRALKRSRVSSSDLQLAAKISLAWVKIVGEPMRQFCFPVKVNNGRLKIGITSQVWLAEAIYLKDVFLKNVQAIVGNRIVGVDFSILSKEPLKTGKVVERALVESKGKVTEVQSDLMNKALENIRDPELRENVRRVLIKSVLFAHKN
jgi:hypothetical protein